MDTEDLRQALAHERTDLATDALRALAQEMRVALGLLTAYTAHRSECGTRDEAFYERWAHMVILRDHVDRAICVIERGLREVALEAQGERTEP